MIRRHQDFQSPHRRETIEPEDREIRECLAAAALRRQAYHVDRGDVNASREVYGELVALAGARSDEPVVRLRRAEGASNMVVLFGRRGDVEAARKAFAEVAALVEAHPEDAALRAVLANITSFASRYPEVARAIRPTA